ncbi:protein-glutamate methylesterase/protein-glutamine glutaminase [Rhizorhapis suberifaciens]|uniref:Protein-glutamate methylesterase/protein-glutamine glutaminase n=1 Tax=Rhizorhapis suberifaciens TaxID=13656 RepID=A0A840HWZ9_9SPHN|nr:chemotaxis response regulator protein-glutamate methylesterase [Rhizorhapis suberifaciens]MBB4642137.1 two-component system chemotaxis response regulator CheB [Rhizorhapis suberifaciens]
MTVRALVVDDSPTMRALLSASLNRDPDIEVVGMASNALEGRQLIKDLDPDVVTLDIEMPGMSGLEFLEKIMTLRPTPVVVISGLTHKGAETTMRALELGAVDCYAKPQGPFNDNELSYIVRHAARSKIRRLEPRQQVARVQTEFRPNGNIVAIGSSTGGVEALIQLLQGWPVNCPPTLIVQHIGSSFSGALASRLDAHCAARVSLAQADQFLENGHVYIAPGNSHLTVHSAQRPYCRLIDSDPVSGHRPSVDMLFTSVAKVLGSRAVGVILTGMGSDGARGLLEMRNSGCETFAQDKDSCVVYGMPRAAVEMGAANHVLPLGNLAGRIIEKCHS